MKRNFFVSLTASVAASIILLTGCSASPSSTSQSAPVETENSPTVQAPSAIEGLDAEARDRQVVVTFDAPSSSDEPVNGYEYRLGGGEWQAIDALGEVASNRREFRVLDLMNGAPVDIGVRAVNDAGPGAEATLSAVPRESHQLTAGTDHALVLSGSNLYAWGDAGSGRLGDGTDSGNKPVTKITSEMNFTHISAGTFHTLALDREDRPWSWGANTVGQLGNASATEGVNVPTRVDVPRSRKFVAIEAGAGHSLAIDDNGSVWSWGENRQGQVIGDGTINKPTPQKLSVPDAVTFADVAAGLGHSLALDSDGNIWSWGTNNKGQLGHGDTDNRATPTQVLVAGSPRFASVYASEQGSLALDRDGQIWHWGADLDDPSQTLAPSQLTNVEVDDPTFVRLAVGRRHAVAVDRAGKLWTWGLGGSGQLGHGDGHDVAAPMRVSFAADELPAPFVRIAAGGDSSYALDEDGNLWTWGSNSSDELGRGSDLSADSKRKPGKIQSQPFEINP